MMVRITGLFYLSIVSKITFKLTQMNLEPDSLEVGSVLNWCSEKTIAPLYKGTIYSLKRSSNAPSFKATLNSWLKKDYTPLIYRQKPKSKPRQCSFSGKGKIEEDGSGKAASRVEGRN